MVVVVHHRCWEGGGCSGDDEGDEGDADAVVAACV
jgi:hypothetical protein